MLKCVKVRNFKCFENQIVKLAPLTLLAGLNGMGKSTVIQTLLLLRQSFKQGILKTGLALNGDLVWVGTGSDALYQRADTEEIEFEICTDSETYGKWTWQYNKDADVLHQKEFHMNGEIYTNSLFTDDFQYLCAERLGPRTVFSTSNFEVSQHNQIGKQGQYAVHFLEVHGHKEISNKNLRHPDVPELDLKSQVDAWLNTISPGVRMSIVPHLNMDIVQLNYQYAAGGELSNHFRSTNVGFGVTNVLPVLVAILSAKPGTLLLIENPEAHLHPSGQAQIGKLLALASASGVQVLVETHSDHVLNGIRVSVKNGWIAPDKVCLHFFERKVEQDRWFHCITSPTIDRNGRLDMWPEGFFDEWDKSLDELLD